MVIAIDVSQFIIQLGEQTNIHKVIHRKSSIEIKPEIQFQTNEQATIDQFNTQRNTMISIIATSVDHKENAK